MHILVTFKKLYIYYPASTIINIPITKRTIIIKSIYISQCTQNLKLKKYKNKCEKYSQRIILDFFF